MQTIAQAFEKKFLPELELTPSESDNAKQQHPNLREKLQGQLDVEDNFLSGSYGRHTAIRPLNDIDIFLVLEKTPTVHPDLGPDALLRTLEAALAEIYKNKTSRKQARSVNIECSGISFDIVPAFADGDDVYVIPDFEAACWINTNPKIHKTLSTAANERSNKKLKPLLKAIKHSNNAHGKCARSFHLEVLSWEILTSDPGSYMAGLVTLLDGLAARICDPCPDPAELGPDIRPSAAKCLEAQTWLNSIAELAREADGLAADGKLGEAHAKIREIFGPEWPEKGSKRGGGGVIVGGGAVDDSRSRFG
jgi:hypothetical protein